MDPLAVHLAMREAESHMRSGKGPAVIEADVYRYFHQNGPFPGSAFGYRDKAEEAKWRERDPIQKLESELTRRKLVSKDDLVNLRKKSQKVMSDVSLWEADLTKLPGFLQAVQKQLKSFVTIGVFQTVEALVNNTK